MQTDADRFRYDASHDDGLRDAFLSHAQRGLHLVALGLDGRPVLPDWRDVKRPNAYESEQSAALVTRGIGLLLTDDLHVLDCSSKVVADALYDSFKEVVGKPPERLTRSDGREYIVFRTVHDAGYDNWRRSMAQKAGAHFKLRVPGEVVELTPADSPYYDLAPTPPAPPPALVFGAASESKWHVICDAIRNFIANPNVTKEAAELYPFVLRSQPQVILLRHDWRAAFNDHAKVDGDESDIVLPYPETVFEFKMGDVHMALWAMEMQDGKHFDLLCCMRRGHVRTLPLFGGVDAIADALACDTEVTPFTGVDWRALVTESMAHVDAACMALSVGVAGEERKEPCAKAVRNRQKMKQTPPSAYSVMTVRKFERRDREAATTGTHASPIPHIRRAHWRNQPTNAGTVRKKIAATWINKGDLADFASRVRVL